MLLEFYTRQAYDLIVCMNKVEDQFNHHVIGLMILVYCETNPSLTPNTIEMLIFGEMRLNDVPAKILRDTVVF